MNEYEKSMWQEAKSRHNDVFIVPTSRKKAKKTVKDFAEKKVRSSNAIQK